MEHNHFEGFGFAHFLAQCDGVGKAVLVLLLLLSVASGTLIVTRAFDNWRALRRAAAFEARLRATGALEALTPEAGNALSTLVTEALDV